MGTKGRFGAGALLVCGIVVVAGCSSGDLPAGVDAADEESASGPKTTSYTYTNSRVEAAVDGETAELNPFPFSGSTEITDVPLVRVGAACHGEIEETPGAVAIADRGECDFEEKLANLEGWAGGIVVVDSGAADGDEWSLRSPRLELTDIPVLWSTDAGSVDLLTAGSGITIRFSAEVVKETQ